MKKSFFFLLLLCVGTTFLAQFPTSSVHRHSKVKDVSLNISASNSPFTTTTSIVAPVKPSKKLEKLKRKRLYQKLKKLEGKKTLNSKGVIIFIIGLILLLLGIWFLTIASSAGVIIGCFRYFFGITFCTVGGISVIIGMVLSIS